MKNRFLYFAMVILLVLCTCLPSVAFAAEFSITTEDLRDGKVGQSYTQVIRADTDVEWRIKDGSLPTGLLLRKRGISNMCRIAGTPTEAGTYSFVVFAKNSEGYVEKWFSITIADTESVPLVPVTDITGVPATIAVGAEVDLGEKAVVTPEGANSIISWEIVDAGTTGATIDPTFDFLSTTAEGTLTVKATIENGKSETEDFIKEFTITAEDTAPSDEPTSTPSDDPAPTPTPTPELDDIPDTGDDSQTGFMMIALAGLAACIISRRRKQIN